MSSEPRTVVFDLGGVLVDWDPRHLYRKLIADEAAMERFLAAICTDEWNRRQDAGRSFAEATALLVRAHPDKADLIEAYFARWPEMIAGAIAGTVEILSELRRRGVPIAPQTRQSPCPGGHGLLRTGPEATRGCRAPFISGRRCRCSPSPASARRDCAGPTPGR